jgi:hypothetical protein
MFPLVCPDHLLAAVTRITGAEERVRAQQVTGADTAAFERLVESLWSPPEPPPSRREWEARRREQEELDRWARQMTPERFLQIYPDPAGHFTAQGRAAPGTDYRAHAAADLLARFPLQAKAKVEAALRKYKCYIHTVRYLESQENTRKTMRNPHELKAVKPRGPVCLEFLKKKKFLELESNISRLKVEREAEQAARLEQARAAGLLQECQCCYAEGCLEEQMVPCKAGHLYCTECVARAAEVAAGDNKTAVGCFGDCDQEIDWRQLDRVVEPRLLSRASGRGRR